MAKALKKRTTARKKNPVKSQIESYEVDDYSPKSVLPSGKGITPLKIITGLIVIFIAVFVFRKISSTDSFTSQLKSRIIPDAVKKVIGDPNVKIKSISDLRDTNGLYEFDLTLDNGTNNPQKYTSYITHDGKILFQGGIKLDTLNTNNTQAGIQPTGAKLSCDSVAKSESPKLTAFLVSNCPFGLQMQRVYKNALSEQPELGNYLDIKYIGSVVNGKITSMHGDNEAVENLRQICIREEQKDKFWNYLTCYMKEGKTDDCLSQTGVNLTQLNSCMSDQSRGNKYAQADFDLANKFAVNSSPTLLLNDKQTVSEFDFGGRTANSIKDVVCCSFSNKPGFCTKDLNKDNVATSFSLTDASAANSNPASCGTN